MTRPTEDQVREAYRVLRADYYSDVKDVALKIIRAVKAGDFNPLQDSMGDYLHEMIYGHRRVFIPLQAKCGLLASDNAYWDTFGPGETPSVEAQMYAAMMRDVIERIEAEGYDIWPYIDYEWLVCAHEGL